MKIYDWKRRGADESALNDVENTIFTFDNLKPAPGSRKRKQRKGRGIAAGQGATCGFGMRGQKSRAGKPTRAGFEGGQQPLYRRLPKFVGRPMGPGHSYTKYNVIKLDELNNVAAGETVNCKYPQFELVSDCIFFRILSSIFPKSTQYYLARKLVDSLFESGAITKSKLDIHKIVSGKDEFTAKDITVQAHAFTKTARAAIESNGGKCELLKPTTGEVIAA